MSGINFADVLWRMQEGFMKEKDNYIGRFRAFENVFNYFQEGQTVAQIACGSIPEDLFLTMERVGREGRIILIDRDPAFVYNRMSEILGVKNVFKGEEFYTQTKEFYTQTEEGKQVLKNLFSEANIEAYIQRLPPYPEQIKDASIDHVMAINAAFELMGSPMGEGPPDFEGLITETYKKLRKDGGLIVQGIMDEDISLFGIHVHDIAEDKGLSFEEDYILQERLEGHFSYAGRGYWARWVKKE